MTIVNASYHPATMPAGAGFRPRAASRSNVMVAVVLLYTLLLPTQFNVTIADVYLSPFRVYLIGASLYVFAGALRQSMRFTVPDLLVLLATAWITVASYMTSGSLATAAIIGGSHAVDIGLSYFVARATIQTPDDLRRFLIMIAPGVGVVGVTVALEAVTHTLIMQRIAGALTGMPIPRRLDVRLGLMRGFGPFPHPILAGICLGSLWPIYLLSGVRGWPRMAGLAGALGGVFSMSSAAMLALVVGGLLVVYDWISERIGNLSWRVFLAFAAVLYGVVELTTQSGFYNLLIRYASLNTTSAYNRVLIWRFGTRNIANNPWFGIGYSDWERPDWMHSDSFDHFWLILSLRFGIAVTVLLLGATLLGIAMIALRSRNMAAHDARLLRGVAVSMAVFALGLNSVSLWMSSLAWFFMLLGIMVSLASQPAPQSFVPRPPFRGPVNHRYPPALANPLPRTPSRN